MFKALKFFIFSIILSNIYSVTVYAEEFTPIDCMIEPNLVVELSSPVEGVLESLLVDRSDEVKKGQIIGTLNSDIERVAVSTSKERLKLITLENQRANDLYRDKIITLSDKDKSDTEKKLSELDLLQAEANLDKRKIRSPIDGQIVSRYVNPGEFVETNPIFKIAQLDPLKIEVVSSINNFGKIYKGMIAEIVPEFGNYKGLYAKVIIVDKVIDAASGTFGVRLELDNKSHNIPGGLKCKAKFIYDEEIVNNNKKPVEVVDKKINNIIINDSFRIVDKTDIVDKNNSDPLVCASFGPYKKKSTIDDLVVNLNGSYLKKTLRRVVADKKYYQINGAIFSTSSEALNKIKEMKKDGISDISIIKYNDKYRISLGLFGNKKSADRRYNYFSKKNYSVSIDILDRKTNKYWLDVVYSEKSNDIINAFVSKEYRNTCVSDIQTKMMAID